MGGGWIHGGRAWVRDQSLVVAAVALCGMLYVALGLVRYFGGHAGNYDLGIFSQAAMAWSQGEAPSSRIRGLDNLFGDHFSPITALFGLAWTVWADPRALILTQALALMCMLLIVGHCARTSLGGGWALAIVVLCGGSLAVVSAARFDVHEATLAAPFVAATCHGLLHRRPAWLLVGAVGLLLAKEDLGLTVAVAGCLWWRRGHRAAGLGIALLGIGWTCMAFGLIAHFSPTSSSQYLHHVTGGAVVDASTMQRLAPVALFAAAAGFIGLRSDLALLALPTLAWRTLSANPNYWSVGYHYDVVLAPIAALSLVDVLSRQRARALTIGLAVASSSAVMVMGLVRLSNYPILDPAAYHYSPTLADARRLAVIVPDGDPIAVQQKLGPALVNRLDVSMLATNSSQPVRWVQLVMTDSDLGASRSEKAAWLADTASRAGTIRWQQGDVVLVRLPTASIPRLPDL